MDPGNKCRMTTSVPASLLVLKIGGSLAESGRLGHVLDLVGRATRPLVVVPGGGPFADSVRAAQREFGFSDSAAHRMAILAMHQMAILFADMQPKLRPSATPEDFAAAWGWGAIPVWLPFAMVHGDPQLLRSWSTTSDGLAAWLAGKLDGAAIALVKSCRVPAGALAPALAEAGIVDPEFPRLVAAAGLDWRVLGAGDEEHLDVLLGCRQGEDTRSA